MRAGWNGAVEHHEVHGLVQVQRWLEEVEDRGACEHGGADVLAMVEEVLLGCEGAHAVAQQHQRDRRVLLAGPDPEPVDVVAEFGPALPADLAEFVLGPRCRPVPAVVLG